MSDPKLPTRIVREPIVPPKPGGSASVPARPPNWRTTPEPPDAVGRSLIIRQNPLPPNHGDSREPVEPQRWWAFFAITLEYSIDGEEVDCETCSSHDEWEPDDEGGGVHHQHHHFDHWVTSFSVECFDAFPSRIEAERSLRAWASERLDVDPEASVADITGDALSNRFAVGIEPIYLRGENAYREFRAGLIDPSSD